MSMSNKRRRDLARILHLTLAFPLGFAIYAPSDLVLQAREVFQVVLFPLLVSSGLWLWWGQRLLARWKRGRHHAANGA